MARKNWSDAILVKIITRMKLLFSSDLGDGDCSYSGARGPPQFLKKRSENAGANENLSGGFAAIPGIAPRVAPRIVGFVLIKSWEAIPRMEFRIPRMEFPIPRAAPRIPRNSPRAPRMAFSLRERFSWNWGGPQASELQLSGVCRISLHYSYSFLVFGQHAAIGKIISLGNFQEFAAAPVTWFSVFWVSNVMISKRMVISTRRVRF